jgi:signal transduction histidine kinase
MQQRHGKTFAPGSMSPATASPARLDFPLEDVDAPLKVETTGSRLRSSIGLRLLVLVVLFSMVVTAISTCGQLYLDYRRDLAAIETHFDEVEHSNLNVLASSLWNVDVEQVQALLDGLMRLPDMQAATVTEAGDYASHLVLKAGSPQAHPALFRDFPIVYTADGVTQRIGTLHMEASLDGLYHRLQRTAVTTALTQAVKTFLISLFVMLLFYRLVARHLTTISQWLAGFTLVGDRPALALAGKPGAHPDELDRLVAALNSMTNRLRNAYQALTNANRQLEAQLLARQQAEREIHRLNAILEQRVAQRTMELQAANEELSAFAYSVSHDLRAPLRRIEGFGQILTAEFSERLDQRGLHYLDRMCAGSRDMADMIDSFLRLSRSTRGELTLDDLDLSEMAQAAFQQLQEKSPERIVEVTVAPALSARADRRLMGVVLENLFANAWKYTRKTPAARIQFEAFDNGDGVHGFFVRDNGAGFDMANAKRLFAPFVRLHRTEDFEGTGVGLTTVQRIIVRHGGRVWADAAVGQGATFYFTLWERGSTNES